jgi:hypothetical protein
MAELVEEREESRQHHRKPIDKLEEEVLSPLRQQLDAETSTFFVRSCEVGELSKELETSRQRVAALEEKECSQRLHVCEMYTIVDKYMFINTLHTVMQCHVQSYLNSLYNSLPRQSL